MKNCYKLAMTAAIFGFGLGTLNAAQAASVNVSTSNQGWWSTGANNFNDNNNYITGNYNSDGYNTFFSFDLGGVAGVSSATLKLQRFEGSGNPTQTLGFFDVSTSANILSQKGNSPNINIYNDLGSGKNYGNFEVSTVGNSDEILSFVLNSDAIADINARSGRFFSIGGALQGDIKPGDQYLFGYSDPWSAQLAINADSTPVPEPLTLGGTAIAGVMGWWLKRKQKASQAI